MPVGNGKSRRLSVYTRDGSVPSAGRGLNPAIQARPQVSPSAGVDDATEWTRAHSLCGMDAAGGPVPFDGGRSIVDRDQGAAPKLGRYFGLLAEQRPAAVAF